MKNSTTAVIGSICKTLILGVGLGATGLHAATIELVADNDFAVFAGTSTSIDRVIYQNGVVWNSQTGLVGSLPSFTPESGETTLYVLAMGGGGPQENLSGRLGGLDITSPEAGVTRSQNIAGLLTGYNLGNVANGSYTPTLENLQTIFQGLVFEDPGTPNNSQTVIVANPIATEGFIFSTGNAHVYRYVAVDDPDVSPVPEPSSQLVLGVLFGAALAFRNRRK